MQSIFSIAAKAVIILLHDDGKVQYRLEATVTIQKTAIYRHASYIMADPRDDPSKHVSKTNATTSVYWVPFRRSNYGSIVECV